MSTQIKQVVTPGHPSVFVASSSEGKPYAEAVALHLSPHADVDVWANPSVFSINRSFLDSLLDSAAFYDFGIAIMTPDDEITVRDETGYTARDNVIFEYGLFLGRLGPNRAFMLKEATVRTFSDFAGISIASFEAGADPVEATRVACARILDLFAEAEENYEVSLLPSSTLALGYHHNFLEPLLDALLEGKMLKVVDESRPDGARRVEYAVDHLRFTIFLPRRLADLKNRPLKKRMRDLRKVTLETPVRPFPFYVEGELGGHTLELFDVPTTLRSSLYAIEHIFTDSFLRKPGNRLRIERREISNFEKTLRLVLEDELEDGLVQFRLLDE